MSIVYLYTIMQLSLFFPHSILRLYVSRSKRPSLLATIREAAMSPVVLDIVFAICRKGLIPIISPIASIGTPRSARTTHRQTILAPGGRLTEALMGALWQSPAGSLMGALWQSPAGSRMYFGESPAGSRKHYGKAPEGSRRRKNALAHCRAQKDCAGVFRSCAVRYGSVKLMHRQFFSLIIQRPEEPRSLLRRFVL